MTRTVRLAGTSLELVERGQGRPLLFLHAGEGLAPERPWLELLSRHYRVIAPWHPGYGSSPLIEGGAGGGRRPGLPLSRSRRRIGPRGRGAGRRRSRRLDRGRDDGAFDRPLLLPGSGRRRSASNCAAATSATSPTCTPSTRAEYLRLAWADPAKGEVDYTALPESELAAIVRGREAFALYGWKPYMHNPRLRRWLHRIDRPTLLLWGAQDGIVTPAYGEGWRQEIPGARLDIIPEAGHFPHWEQPEEFVQRLSAFVDGRNA